MDRETQVKTINGIIDMMQSEKPNHVKIMADLHKSVPGEVMMKHLKKMYESLLETVDTTTKWGSFLLVMEDYLLQPNKPLSENEKRMFYMTWTVWEKEKDDVPEEIAHLINFLKYSLKAGTPACRVMMFDKYLEMNKGWKAFQFIAKILEEVLQKVVKDELEKIDDGADETTKEEKLESKTYHLPNGWSIEIKQSKEDCFDWNTKLLKDGVVIWDTVVMCPTGIPSKHQCILDITRYFVPWLMDLSFDPPVPKVNQ